MHTAAAGVAKQNLDEAERYQQQSLKKKFHSLCNYNKSIILT
jgi:hypothetical protein